VSVCQRWRGNIIYFYRAAEHPLVVVTY
jgi:hypothetical protein